MKPRHQRFLLIAAGISALAIAGAFVLNALSFSRLRRFTKAKRPRARPFG